jgi:type IV pilus assembly protein PilC
MTAIVWRYTAVDGDGNSVRGEVRARSEGDAVSRVRDLGYRPIVLRRPSTNVFRAEINTSLFAPKVKPAELAGSIRQLAAMLRAGVPMMRALTVLVQQSSPALEAAWSRVRADIEGGDALSLSVERHPRIFDPVFVSLVVAGEASGTLDEALQQAATALERKAELRRKVRGALAYPIAVLGLVGVVILAMSLFVVPVFRNVYADLGGELPVPTRIVLGVSGFIGGNLLFLVGAVMLAAAALRRWKRTPAGELALATIVMRTPVVGDLVRRTALARASRSLAVLAAAGVPLLEALQIAGNVSGNAVMRRVFTDAAEAIRAGRSLSSELTNSDVIPPLFAQVIAVGEESGDLTEMLRLVGDVYEAEVDTAAESFSAVAEPLLIAFLGIVVGGIVLSLYLPMFRLIDLVQ